MKGITLSMPNPPERTAGSVSDLDLVRAARSGDRAAYGELYKRYAPMVHGLVLTRIPPRHADDIVQEVFLKAMSRIAHLREDGHFGGWIAAIARNLANDHYRHGQELPSAEEDMAKLETGEAPGAGTEARLVLAAIQSLPKAYRETLALRLVEGMTGPEIAARAGLTQRSVRVNLHRGMKMLRKRLGAGAARPAKRTRESAQ